MAGRGGRARPPPRGADRVGQDARGVPRDPRPPPPRAARRGGRARPLRVAAEGLNNDIQRDPDAPLAGIAQVAAGLGIAVPEIRTAVRTGDAAANERHRMTRKPPRILITTPESLYLILASSRARDMLRSVEHVIDGEIHAVAGTKRGSHLALSLERVRRLTGADFQRVGLSAAVRPLEDVGRFLVGCDESGRRRPVDIVDAGSRRPTDLLVASPVVDLEALGGGLDAWTAIEPRLLALVRAHRTTLLFVNDRRSSERLTRVINDLAQEEVARAHHGSMSREERLEVEAALNAESCAASSRRARSSSGSTSAPSTSSSASSPRAASRSACSVWGGRDTSSVRPRGAGSSRSSAATSSSARRSRRACSRATSSRCGCRTTSSASSRCSRASTRRRSSESSARASCGTARAGSSAAGPAPPGSRSSPAARSPTAGSSRSFTRSPARSRPCRSGRATRSAGSGRPACASRACSPSCGRAWTTPASSSSSVMSSVTAGSSSTRPSDGWSCGRGPWRSGRRSAGTAGAPTSRSRTTASTSVWPCRTPATPSTSSAAWTPRTSRSTCIRRCRGRSSSPRASARTPSARPPAAPGARAADPVMAAAPARGRPARGRPPP